MSAELVLKAINDNAAAQRKEREEHAAILKTLETNSRNQAGQLFDMQQELASLKGAPSATHMVNSQNRALSLLLKDAKLAEVAEQRMRRTLKFPHCIKSLLTSVQGGADASPATGYDVAAVRDPNLYFAPPRPPTLLDVLPVLPMTVGNTHEFVQIIEDDNSPGNPDAGADYQVSEGDLKPEANIHFELQSVTAATIAVCQLCSRQLLTDVAMFMMMLGNFLASRVRSAVDRRVLTGTGGKGKILGLVQQATPYVAIGAAPDRIGGALAALEGMGFFAPFVVMNPAQWNDIRTDRATTGEYVTPGWAMPMPASIWGAPVIRNSALPVGSALIVDRTAARYIDRMQTTVEISTEDGDNFRRNLATILCETRGTVEVTQPSGVLTVALDTSP